MAGSRLPLDKWVLAFMAYDTHRTAEQTAKALLEETGVARRTADVIAKRIHRAYRDTDMRLAQDPAIAPRVDEIESRLAKELDDVRKQLEETKQQALKAQEDSDDLLATVRTMKAKQAALEAARGGHSDAPKDAPAHPRKWLLAPLIAVSALVWAGWRMRPALAGPPSIASISHNYLGKIPVDEALSRVSIVDSEHRYITHQKPDESDEEWHRRHNDEVDAFRQLLLTRK